MKREVCERCDGYGFLGKLVKVYDDSGNWFRWKRQHEKDCPVCDGRGIVYKPLAGETL